MLYKSRHHNHHNTRSSRYLQLHITCLQTHEYAYTLSVSLANTVILRHCSRIMTSTVSALYHFSIGTFGFFLQDLAVVAVQCMCKLLTTHPHFNYRSDVITFLVPLMTHRHSKVSPGPQCVCTVLHVFCVCLCVSSVCMSSVSVCVCKHPKVTHGLLHHSGCVLCLFMYVQCVCLCVSVCRHPKVQFWFPAPQWGVFSCM